ncbi:M61 family metallopeptidase [Muricauda sp. CAU 1633]|uniref:M61 family metallopeptidase n=1 Tax=Allomuricauda sp. CAU 1633 TaxID=2816036 RepID=UPI001A8F990F|nr:M61 family metallopeptidase [Muricauda sp. CAU 1633]MBO0321805.1 M61 family metallopeptidase [Muricauda sp. CAU 1633]
MKQHRSFWVLVNVILMLTCSIGFGQTKMDYQVRFVEPEKHYAEVQLDCSGLSEGQTNFVLPVWSPGYYQILDSPKHIIDFEVKNAKGEDLEWGKKSKNIWEVENGTNDAIVITYRVFANRKSVAESKIDSTKAFIMPNNMFMHVQDKINQPVSVQFSPYKDWNKISTGLKSTTKGTFYAKDFDILYDSPVYIGNQKTLEFENDGKSYHLGVATPEGLNEEKFVGDLKKIMNATTELMQHIPYDNYSYILMEAGGGGLEHWNSQAVFTSGSFNFRSEDHYVDFMNFITHEYFHLYNVKAIRPIELGPFDYSKENYTDMLWVSEGITVYYEYLIMMRAGLLSLEKALDYLSSSIRRYENIEGKNHMSLSRSSFDIWLNFLSRDENTDETTISYYNKGPIIGFLLDLEIRHGSNNRKSLDDVMRFLYNEYYLKQGRGFKKEEFWATCEEIAGRPLDEIRTYVDTVTPIDYQKYLEYAGLQIDLSSLEEQDKNSELVKRSYQISEKSIAAKKQLQIRNSVFRTN